MPQRSATFFSVEPLEPRRLLSAVTSGVTAAVVDGTLFVTGTEADEAIKVVRGRDGVTHVSAIVAGEAERQFAFAPWSYHTLCLDGRGGDDQLAALSLILPNGGSILAGDGDDVVLLHYSNINGDFFVDGGAGDDFLAVSGNTFEGVSLHAGDGRDKLFASDLIVWNYATFDLGAGDDELRLTDVTAYGWTSADGGAGRDLVVAHNAVFAGGSNVIAFEDEVEW